MRAPRNCRTCAPSRCRLFRRTSDAAKSRVERLRTLIPSHVTIGVSGDAFSAAGLNAGCQAWYSVIGRLLPKKSLAVTRTAQAGDAQEAMHLS